MSLLRVARLRFRALFQREALNRELEEELQFHIDQQTEANLRAGMSPQEARRQAVLLFGGIEGHKEESRRAQGFDLMGARASWLDLKLGLRMLVKYPGLTLVGGLALTVATGLGAAFFQFSENMFNPRIPLDDADRIVAIESWDLAARRAEPRLLHDFAEWREQLRTVEELGVVRVLDGVAVTTEDRYTESLDVAQISVSTLRVTGVAPLLGRPLLEEDERPGAPPVVLLGYPAWQRLFGKDPGVVGEVVRVGANPATVVGVMPEGYGFPVNEDAWVPFPAYGMASAPREGPPVKVVGRLRPGVDLEEAQAELATLGAQASADRPETHQQLRPRVERYAESLIMDEEMRWAIYMLRFVFVLLMMLMCVNVATLVFARTAARESEFAVRSALGASRRRIVSQLFMEGLALTLVCAALGLGAAWMGLRWGMEIFWRVQEVQTPPFWWTDDLRVGTILYAVVLALAGAALVGIVPALKVTGRRVRSTLAQMSAGNPRLRFGGVWTVIVVIQVALSVAFLPTAVLTARSALQDAERSSGFPADAYLTAQLTRETGVPLSDLAEAERAEAQARWGELQQEVKRRVAAEPGVAQVAFANGLSGMNHQREVIHVIDATAADVPSDTSAGPASRALGVDLDYFGAMGASMVAGRAFQPGDVASGASVIVNESFVQEVMNGQNPVGQRIRYPRREDDGAAERWYEVVGVVEDPPMDAFGPGEHAAVYHPLKPGSEAALQMFVRAGPGAGALGARLRATIASVDPSLRLGEVRTVREAWAPSHQAARLFGAMYLLVALVALLLSMAGIHALMAFTVSQRTREIGIRAALGAHPARIVRAVFSRAFAQLGIGVLLGSALAAAVRHEDLATEGPAMLLTIVATMLTVGLLACYLPARRALRIQPTQALKSG